MIETNRVITTLTGETNPGTSLDGTDASPASTTKDELFQIDYVEQVTDAEETGELLLRPVLNPYPIQTPANILGRPIKVLDEHFGTTLSHTTFLSQWNSHYDYILKYFRYFRADFKLQFILRSSGTQYGCGLISWIRGLPYDSLLNLTDDGRLRRTSADSYLIDYSSADALEIYVPFLYHKPYINRELVGDLSYYMTFFTDNVFLNSISTGTDSSVSLTVYLSAHNIDVGGYRNDAVTPLNQVVNAHSSCQGMNSMKNPNADRFQQAATALGALNSLYSLGSKFVNQGFTFGDFVDKSSINPGSVSTVTTALQTAAGFKSMSVPATNISLDQAGVVQENAAQGVKIAMYGNMNQITKNKQIPELAETRMGSAMYPPSNHKLADIASLPVVQQFEEFTIDNETKIITLENVGWIEAIKQHFRMIRGTYRIGLHFICHPLVAGRFQVQFFPTNAIAYVPNTMTTDVPTFNFLVKGTDSKMFDLPYHQDTYALDSGDHWGVCRVTMTHKPTQFATGVDLSIGMVVTVSLAEDAQFFSVRNLPGKDIAGPALKENVDEELVEAHSLRRLHSQPAEIPVGAGSAPQIPYLPEISSVEELAQRWSARVAASALAHQRYGVTPISYFYGVDKTGSANQAIYGSKYDCIADWFYLTRSSVDIRVVLLKTDNLDDAFATMTDGVEIQSIGARNAKDPANGGTYTRESQMPVLEYRAPFISVWNASSAGNVQKIAGVNTNADLFIGTQTSSFYQDIYLKAAEDLRYDHINVLPPGYKRPLV